MVGNNRIKLPKDPDSLSRIINSHADREETRMGYQRAMWLLGSYYLQGHRNFQLFQPRTGEVIPGALDNEGKMQYQHGELLNHLNQVIGRLGGMDVRPKVERVGMSLPAIRDRSTTQVVLDSVTDEVKLAETHLKLCYLFTAMGSVGIHMPVEDDVNVGLTSSPEVIHPKELMPFPSVHNDPSKAQGMMRIRLVPMGRLIEKYGKKVNKDKIEWWEADPGDVWEYDDYFGTDHLHMDTRRGTSNTQVKETVGVAKVRELWLDGARGTCSRYILQSGDVILDDQRYHDDQVEAYCPVGFGRMLWNGTWHGAGMIHLLYCVHRELEWMLEKLFNNVRDADYAILVLPQSDMPLSHELRDIGRGLRILPWEPDSGALTEGQRPVVISPPSSGEFPGRVAAMAREIMNGLNPVRNLIEEKGRVDSAVGLSFLDEQINQALSTSAQGILSAYSAAYRSVAHETFRMMAQSPRAIPVQHITTDMAGVVIDPRTYEVNFPENSVLPSQARLNYTVRHLSPKSEVVRKQEGLQMLQMVPGLAEDLDRFIIFGLQEGLDFGTWTGEETSAVEMITLNILLLYGDGDTPGSVVSTPEIAAPRIQLRIMESFMSGPMMSVASPPIIDAFADYKMFLLTNEGTMLPEGVPAVDELAQEEPGQDGLQLVG